MKRIVSLLLSLSIAAAIPLPWATPAAAVA